MKPSEDLKLSKDFQDAVDVIRDAKDPAFTIVKGMMERRLEIEGKDSLYKMLEESIAIRALKECAALKDLGLEIEPYMNAYVRNIAYAYGYEEK